MAEVEGKATALKKWLKGWEGVQGHIKLSAINAETSDKSLNIVENDHVLQKYIDGTAKREYTFALKMMVEWSNSFDTINDESQALMDSWLDWVAVQYPDNVPQWEHAKITNIEPLYNVSALSNVYQDEGLAEYMFQAKITYEE